MEDEKSRAISLMQPNENERNIDFMKKKLPPIEHKVKINYEKLLSLSREVEDRERVSREDAHQAFMENYHSIFHHEPKVKSTLFSSLAKKPQKFSKPLAIKDESHNVTEHLSKLHRRRLSEKDERIGDLMKRIRKYSKTPPYERSSKENQQLTKCLLDVKCLSHIPRRVIEKLVTTAHLEHWDPDFTVFGESGLYLIVKGTCLPSGSHGMSQSPMTSRMESHLSLDCISERHSLQKASMKLYPGDHFGKLEINNDDVTTSIMSVVTQEECEILRFSNASFQRVTKHIRDKESGNKLQLAQTCKLFKDWPKLSLKRISEIFQWAVVPPGEILGLEGTMATSVCFIKQGVCQLKKVLSVASTNQDGKTVKRKQEVVIGNLGPGDSFGEKSFITNDLLEQSVVAEKNLIIAIIGVEDFEGLDDVTKALFRQTCEAADSKTSKEAIKRNYTQKQAELEWKSKKEEIVRDILYYNGISPGYSKWSRNPRLEDVQHLKDIK